jgi:hypothetical protein
MNIPSGRVVSLLALLLAAIADPLAAQSVALPGSMAEERARAAEILGDTGRREPGMFPGPDRRLTWRYVRPEARLTWNSSIPYTLNDGSLWAGRGASGSVSAGVAVDLPVRRATLRVVLAPSVSYSENRPFQIFPGTDPSRSGFANPFYPARTSADYPMRFGDQPFVVIDPGRSSASLSIRNTLVGASTEPEWWGPAIRNTLVMSNNAAGVPRLFVRTRQPLSTRLGPLDAQYVAGLLTESPFFDRDDENDYRSLSGFRVRLRPAFDTTLSLGVARMVFGHTKYALLGPLSHAADAVIHWEFVNDAGEMDADQLMSLFLRWVFPGAGFEVYGEFARLDNPRNVTELLIASNHTGGYTLGAQWARPFLNGHLRLQSELTYLEQSTVFPDRPTQDFYSGRAAPQGYTQRGQVLGAAIGPGGSSQFIAIDHLAPAWQLGWYVGRVRWNNDALYRWLAPNFLQHDATLLSGFRGGWRTRHTDYSVETTWGYRYNYLFQWGGFNPGGFRTVDVRNFTLALKATPR